MEGMDVRGLAKILRRQLYAAQSIVNMHITHTAHNYMQTVLSPAASFTVALAADMTATVSLLGVTLTL